MSSIQELKKQIEKKAKIQKEIMEKKYDEKIKEFKTNYEKAIIKKEEEEKEYIIGKMVIDMKVILKMIK